MGFREPEARRALGLVYARRAAHERPPRVADIVRDALGVLT
jgi:hypothetical protein